MNESDNLRSDPTSDPDSAVSPAELQAIRSALRDVEPVDDLTRRRVLRAALAAFDDGVLDTAGSAVPESAVPDDANGDRVQPVPLAGRRQRWFQRTALVGAAAAAVVVAVVVSTSGDRSGDDAASVKVAADDSTFEARAESGAEAAAPAAFDATTAAASDTSLAAEALGVPGDGGAESTRAATTNAGPVADAATAATTVPVEGESTSLPNPSGAQFDDADLGADLGTFNDAASLVTALVNRLDAVSPAPNATTTAITNATNAPVATTSGTADAVCPITDEQSARTTVVIPTRARVDGVDVQVYVVGRGAERVVIGLDAETCAVVFELAAPPVRS